MLGKVFSRFEQYSLEKSSTLCIYSRPIPFFITQYITRLAFPSMPLMVHELP